MLLEGKKVLVTGGSRGIGKAMVLRCLAEGADVWFISTKPSPFQEEMQAAADEVSRKLTWKACDVSDEEQVKNIVEEIIKESGGLDTLVNNAGITRDGLVFRMKGDDFDAVMKVNLYSAFYFSREVSRSMIKKRTGSIINISSIVGVKGNAGQCNYAASKAGLIGFTKSLAKETATRGIRANVIAPGFIESDMTDKLKENVKEELLKTIPLGRMGKADEIADTVVYLASGLSSYVTGQVLLVDGGMGI